MNSPHFPVQVVVLLRRLANILSTLSISHQYFFFKSVQPKDDLAEQVVDPLASSQTILQAFLELSWPRWIYGHSWGWRQEILISSTSEYLSWLRPNWPWMHKEHSHVPGAPSNAIPSCKPILQEASESSISTIGCVHSSITTPPKGPVARLAGGQTTKSPEASPCHNHSFSTISEHSSDSSQASQDTSHPDDHSLAHSLGDPDRDRHEPNEPLPPPKRSSVIHQLLRYPALYDPLRTPRFPIVLCHGLYGFDVRGPSSFPSLRIHYWSSVLNILRKTVCADVIVTSVPGTGSILSRAEMLNSQLSERARGRGINFLAHSMGGLDCRHLISSIRPSEYAPLSLTTIGTPHRGSPFMDWCADHFGLGKQREKERSMRRSENDLEKISFSASLGSLSPTPHASSDPLSRASRSETKSNASNPFILSLSTLPSSFTTLLLSLVDTPAYFNLKTSYLAEHFNLNTPDDPHVKYFSIAGRLQSVSVFHPFWLPKMVLDDVEEKERKRLKDEWMLAYGTDQAAGGCEKPLWAQEEEWGNDGLVPVQSAKWGKFLGIMEGCDHWELRGARGITGDLHVDLMGDMWKVKDWRRYVSAFRKEEKGEHDSGLKNGGEPKKETKREREKLDADVKSSTDKLSAVFDWIVEQVPTAPKVQASTPSMEKPKDVAKERRNELASKADLERFYVALSRKLYDEGL